MNKISGVGIMIHTVDGQSKEIPLELWQLEVFTLILGLQVDLSNLDTYRMSSREVYEERMNLYKDAIRNMNRTNYFIDEYLSLSEGMRNGYQNSLGNALPNIETFFTAIAPNVPQVFQAIYGKVAGTHRKIANQTYMDFIPGYRLIHIEELESEYHTLLQSLALDDIREAQIRTIIPLLANDSSCYICYAETNNNQEVMFHYSSEDGLQKMHNSTELFFKTIIAFYLNDVFYINKDGFLDYDFEKEGIIGATYNPGIAYWTE